MAICLIKIYLICIMAINVLPKQISSYSNRPIIIPRKFTLVANYFGFNLLNQLNNEQSDDEIRKNILIAPLSLTATLTMLHLATNDGSPANQQLESILAFSMANISPDRHRERESLRKILLKTNDLKNTRALVANQTLKINLDYAQMIQDYFKAEIIINQNPTDFIVNGSTLIEHIPESNEAVMLLDVAFFHGIWLHRFDITNTRPSTFYGANFISYENVPFMRLKAAVAVVPLDEIDAAMIELPFKDQRYALYMILPSRINDDLSLIRRAINPWYIETSIRRMDVYGKIMIELPTFGIEAEYDLRGTLERMGIRDIFHQKMANLSSIMTDQENIFVTDIKHKVRMEFGENGIGPVDSMYTKKRKSKQKSKLNINSKSAALAFDHPFLYFLRHTRTGTILLIGEIHGF